uniref:Heat shock protein Hsp20 n=1 Tax=Cyanothece sp. (strain PCC 7425 / ATCC 29141) TaxID=395961 RepID=B8HWL6_CYAP4
MALMRLQPIYGLNTFKRDFDRMFDQLSNLTWEGLDVNSQTPAIELKETETDVILRAEVPGMSAENLDVQVTRNAVAITGENRHEQKSETKGYFHSEFRYGRFQRIVPLPVKVENDQVKAEFKDGILTLTLPKAADERRKVVKVNLGETQTVEAQ